MGSLASRPSASTEIVYVTSPSSSASASETASTTDAEATTATATAEAAEAARTEDLLRRDRSRVGTVQTSFTGLSTASTKAAAQNAAGRKTLLGE